MKEVGVDKRGAEEVQKKRGIQHSVIHLLIEEREEDDVKTRKQEDKMREDCNTQQSKLTYPWHEHIRRESLVASSYQ